MAIEVKHTTQATGTDAGNGEIRKAQWNESHTLNMATERLLGRTTAGSGAVEEITASTGLTLTAGALAVSKAFPTGDIVGTTDIQNLSNKTFTNNPTFSTGTANGVLYLNGSNVLSSNATLTFDGTALQTSGSAGVPLQVYKYAASGSVIIGQYTASGTSSAPTAVVNGRALGRNNFYGYDGTGFANAAAISVFVDGAVSTGSVPGRIVFTTNSVGGVAVAERMAISAAGNVSIAGLTASKPVFTDASKNLTSAGTLGVDQGGTGQTSYTDGQLLIGNSTGNTLTKAALTAGSGISITNGSGAITIASTGSGASAITISNKTGAYTVVAGDLGTIINCTSGTFTVSLTAAATLGAGFNCTIWNTGDGTVTIDPSGTETIDGTGTTYILRPRAGVEIVCSGTDWLTGANKALRLYQESSPNDPNYTRPVASGFSSVAIGRQASSAGSGALALGRSANASADGAVAIGYATASGLYSLSINNSSGVFNAVASANNSTAIGGNSGNQGSQAVTGSGAMALGGSYASGTDSFAAGVANNTSTYGATRANSIAIGQSAKSSGTSGGAFGGVFNIASGSQSISIGGVSNTASGTSSFVTGTYGNTGLIENKVVFGNGFSTVSGSAQFGVLVLKRSTTNETPQVLTVWDGSPGATNQVILPNNSAYAFSGIIVARRQAAGGTESAAWKVEGLIRREGTAASTTLVASTVTAISNVPGWALALSADTTNGGLAVTATGAAATNIRWVATIETSEVTYA
jgi:hypothetical protein